MSTLLTRLTEDQQKQVLEDGAIFGSAYIYERHDGTVEVLNQTRLEIYFEKSVPMEKTT